METHEVVRAIAQAVGISAPMIAARMGLERTGVWRQLHGQISMRPDMVTVLGDLIVEKMAKARAPIELAQKVLAEEVTIEDLQA
jgi:hypothetical protein